MFHIAENHICVFLSYLKYFLLIFSSHFLISYISFLSSKISSIDFISCLFSSGVDVFKARTSFIPWPSIVYICFSNALPRGEHVT